MRRCYTNLMNTRTLVAAVALLASFACYAEDALQNYDVELVIFRVVNPKGSAENWTIAEKSEQAVTVNSDGEETPSAPVAAPEAPATPAPTNDAAFAPLSPAQFKLNGIEAILHKGKNYLPIAHIGWTQPGYPLGNPPKFSLQSYLPGFLPDGITLSGQASLARGHYLHLLLDLTYQAPDGQRYVLREQRRMRSTDKHYFDHPYFGVIALITPRG
jgi:hypothetical protein